MTFALFCLRPSLIPFTESIGSILKNGLEGHIITVSNFELLSTCSKSVQGLAVSDQLNWRDIILG